MKIGVYVGSFNPVHKGHSKIVKELIDKKILDKVIIIPTKNYWDKQNLISIEHRVNMLKFLENEKIKVCKKYSNHEYTYQILNDLKKEYINDELYLIIGADIMPKFHLWKNIEEILKFKILVINRDDIKIEDYINSFQNKNNFIIVNDIEKIDISSTNIRNNLDEMSKYLDIEVYNYIKNNKLYLNNLEK